MNLMNINICIKHKLLLALIPFIGFLSACNSDWEQNLDQETNKEEQLVSFSVKVPGAFQPKTYALTETEENEIVEVMVLLFDKDDKYTYQPIYSSEVKTDPNQENIKTFTIKVPAGYYCTLLVIANSNKDVLKAISKESDSIKKGDSKASVLRKLKSSTILPWVADSSKSTYKPIPMWGERNNINIDKGINDKISLDLIRAIARIDVKSDSKKTNLVLTSVYLYNYNREGYIAPLNSKWDNTPSVPDQIITSGPIPYSVKTNGYTTYVKNEIYTFEAYKGTWDEGYLNNTCLIVGGKYKGSYETTYYRIDFANGNALDGYTYLDILRNHLYDVDIESVNGPGLPNIDTAVKSRPVNIIAKVVPWNEGAISEVDAGISGEHFITVDKSKFTFAGVSHNESSHDNTLTVGTNYPKGWNISKVLDLDTNTDILKNADAWIKIKDLNGGIGTFPTKILLTENTTGRTRRAKVYVTAGTRLSLVVLVEQNTNQ